MVRHKISFRFLNTDTYNEVVKKFAIRLDSDHDSLGEFFSFLTVTTQINVPYT